MKTDPQMHVSPVKVRGTELSARDTRERYREKIARITLDSMVQFVGLLDAQGTVLEINHVALDAVGIALSEVEGKPFWTTFWWQVSEEINATLREMIARAAQGEFVRWDTPIYGRAGGKETIIIDASLMPVRDEHGNVVFIAAEGRDITEKKAYEREIARQREELAELDKLKTQFFANISHEFRTPLTLMMGPLEDALADVDGLSPANRERLEMARRNAQRQLKLVNTLLDFSRIEAGRIQASYEPTDLAALTAELASVFRSAVERARMKLVVDCPPLPEPVWVDREMWEKIVLNLLSNAFKFTFDGEIRVGLRQAGEAVELSVSDTGTGIAAEELPRLFERFHRVKGAPGRSYEGSGIGLALVQELAELHGGGVRVESEIDRGSNFTLSIPLGTAHLPQERIGAARTLASTGLRSEAYAEEVLRWLPAESEAVDSSSGRLTEREDQSANPQSDTRHPTSKILLADDNADMREYVRRLLAQGGYEVEAVADGLAALNAARERPPDLMLTDVMMPGLDGFGLLAALRSEERTRTLPVILLSARAGEEARVEGMEAGADDYLTKPFSARELLARVESHLQLQRVRREAKQAIAESEERFRAFVTASSDVVYRMNPDWSEMWQLRGREFIADTVEPNGEWLEKYIHPDDQQRVTAAIAEAIRTRSTFELEHRVLRPDGTLGWTFSRAIPILNADGEVVEWFGAASDVTRHKEAEEERAHAEEERERLLALEQAARGQAEAANRLKDEFLATVSHELRTPLTAILGWAHMLRASKFDEEGRGRALEIIERNARAQQQLIEDLLDVSRIITGKLRLDVRPCDPAAFIEAAVEAVRPAAEAKEVRVQKVLDTGISSISGDPARLQQVVWNLLANSIKFTPRGGRVQVRLERVNSHIEIVVSDTGEGIAPEFLPHVFDRFRQADGSTTRAHGGLGLGLAIVRHLVELHGGTVRANSHGAGQGATFTVMLPLIPVYSREPAEERVHPRASNQPLIPVECPERLDGLKLLVVDDERDACELLRAMLTQCGAEITTALSAEEALAEMRRTSFDLLISDVGMPGADGYELIRRVRRLPASEGGRIPSVALTAYARAEDRLRALRAGYQMHVAKPVEPSELIAVIASLAGRGGARETHEES
jgi:PAS domain S-box-containing protein